RRGRSKPRMWAGACRLQPKAASGRCPIRCFSCSPNGCQRRWRPAEAAYLEALAIRRRLAEANPEAYFPYLANSLNNLANLYNDTQRMTEAETAWLEALSIYRRTAEANPEAFMPYVATTLNNLANLYSATHRLRTSS